MKRQIMAAVAASAIFGAGLCLSGMTNPAKVRGFLDLLGRWDPSLAFVMIGALLTHGILFRLITRRRGPVLAERFSIPTKRNIDVPLIAGAALFGVGWGLSGYCPGPAVTSLGSGSVPALVLAAGMPLGFALYGVFDRSRSRQASSSISSAPTT